MSIVFRLKYALGLIPSADQLDVKWENLIKMRDDLSKMENSEELKKYLNLKNLLDSSSFQHQKREIEGLQYSGSEEEILIKEYKNLSKSFAIKNYLNISASPRLERFQEILKGSALKTFQELQKEVASKEFQNRKDALKKKEFVKTEDFGVLKQYNQLRKNKDIRFWHKFGQSENYHSYLKTIGSAELKHWEELKVQTASADFNSKIAYLKDKQRFKKSEEYKSILAFNEIDKGKFMADYRKLKKAKELDFFEKWDIVLDENFTGKELNTKQWQPENWLAMKMAGTSFSQQDEKQCFNGVKNIQLVNNTLSIWTKKEKTSGNSWVPSIGFIPKHYEYTSSILNSAGFFRFKEGVIETKVRFKKDATITSAFSLTGEHPFPQIDLFRSTKKGVGLGIVEKPGSSSAKYKNLNGLNDEHFHIFRLEIYEGMLIWKINGAEVFRSTAYLNEPFFINLLSTLHGTVNEHLLPHRFEIEWIRSYAQK